MQGIFGRRMAKIPRFTEFKKADVGFDSLKWNNKKQSTGILVIAILLVLAGVSIPVFNEPSAKHDYPYQFLISGYLIGLGYIIFLVNLSAHCQLHVEPNKIHYI